LVGSGTLPLSYTAEVESEESQLIEGIRVAKINRLEHQLIYDNVVNAVYLAIVEKKVKRDIIWSMDRPNSVTKQLPRYIAKLVVKAGSNDIV
jgi:hypothetical protein